MVKSEDIVKLYSAVLQKQEDQFDVDADHVITGIKDINATYKPYKRWIARLDSPSTNYDDPAHRCAYLHKHAMIHTGLLCAVLELAMQMYPVKEVMDVDCLKLCCLGSGPGTDIVGCLLFLKEKFGTKRISATLVDCYEGWKFVFDAVVSELKSEEFKDFNHIVSEENFDYEYVPADLLKFDHSAPLLFQRIANADFITMVKFVSAAACRDTRKMVKNLFRAMKPGALILFVDNAAGQFHEMMSDIAKECNMKSVFGPLQHYPFKEEAFRRTFEGYESQYETRIAAEIWKKVDLFPWNTTYELQNQFFNQTRSLVPNFNDENFTTMDSVDYVAIEMVDDGRTDNDRPQGSGAFREPLRIAQGEEKPQNVRLTAENVSEMDNNQKCCTIM